MSVLCCRVPELLLTLHQRVQPLAPDQPLALVGLEGTVWAVSAAARAAVHGAAAGPGPLP